MNMFTRGNTNDGGGWKIDQPGFEDHRQTEQRQSDQQFVGNRIEPDAEPALRIQLSRQIAIQKISQRARKKAEQRKLEPELLKPRQARRIARVCGGQLCAYAPCLEEGPEDQQGEDAAGDGEGVRDPFHALGCASCRRPGQSVCGFQVVWACFRRGFAVYSYVFWRCEPGVECVFNVCSLCTHSPTAH